MTLADRPSAAPDPADVRTLDELARLLRQLRRRHARRAGDSELTFRELAARTGYAYGVIAEYFAGKVLPPTDRFDVLVRLLGASAAEQGALATARDRVEERRRGGGAPVPAATTGPAGPRELPPDVFGFTGREAELRQLDQLLDDAGPQPGAAVISAVAGTAGVGKTALAVRWAHRVDHRFPDGCLYVDLRGYDPDRPVRPEEALAGFLRSLGVTGAALPPDLDARTAHYRTLLAGRRLLVVLDNARGVDQVRPLLPGAPGCMALITSRDTLSGLVVRDGARRLLLDLLPAAEAVDLLRRLVGPRAGAEPAAAAQLAERCARLPLALRIAAELVACRPDATLADLVTELADSQGRLDLLAVDGDHRTAVRAVFSWSLRHLSPPAARAFALLGLHPGHHVDAYTVAALADTDTDPAAAGRLLAELARAHLVQPVGGGRHRMHDLLRAYAAERAGEADETDRRAAEDRLLDAMLATAAAAMDTCYPQERGRRPEVDRGDRPGPAVDSPAAAQAWLDAQRSDLAALVGLAARRGRVRRASALAGTLARDLHAHELDLALVVHGEVLAAARAAGDDRAAGDALHYLGSTELRRGHFDTALAHLLPALAGRRRSGDRGGEGATLNNLGIVLVELGRPSEAVEHLELGLRSSREAGLQATEGYGLCNIGCLYVLLRRYDQALVHLTRARDLLRGLGDAAEGAVLNNLATAYTATGEYTEAGLCLDRALRLHRESGLRPGEVETMIRVGRLRRVTGAHPAAVAVHEQARQLAEELGLKGLLAEAHSDLGDSLLAAGDPAAAVREQEVALRLAEAAANRSRQADALAGAARARLALGEDAEAHRLWSAALPLFVALGLPQADVVRQRLDALDEQRAYG